MTSIPAVLPAYTGAGAGGGLRVELLTNAEDLQALEGPWRDLLADSAADCLFLTWEWLFTWWRHFGNGRQLAVYAGRTGDRLDVLAPLIARERQPLRGRPFLTFEPFGTGSVGSDYLDVIVRRGCERDALDALANRLREDRVLLSFPRVRAEGTAAHELGGRLQHDGWHVQSVNGTVCPYITLAAHTWESYVDSLGREHRANVRRRLRKLQDAFDVRLERAFDDATRRDALQILVDLHTRRWDARGGSTAFHLPALVGFHEDFSRLALERGWLRLYVLRLDGEPAAAIYGLRYGSTFLFYQSGFDPRFAQHAVGLALMGLVIREAIAEGAAEFDMLHGDEPYKFLWAARQRGLHHLELYPPTARGTWSRRITRVARATRAAARTAAARLGRNR